MKQSITLTINGEKFHGEVPVRMLLSDFIRTEVGLTGTHVGCEHGVCGACTVLVNGTSNRSCLMFAVQAEGASLRTIEGLAAPDGTLSPLQEAFRSNHGLQCGFCTPGFLMTAQEFLEGNELTTDRETVREVLSGNICRCTGYETIIDAVIEAAGKELETRG